MEKRRNRRRSWLAAGALTLAAVSATGQTGQGLSDLPALSWALGITGLWLLISRS